MAFASEVSRDPELVAPPTCVTGPRTRFTSFSGVDGCSSSAVLFVRSSLSSTASATDNLSSISSSLLELLLLLLLLAGRSFRRTPRCTGIPTGVGAAAAAAVSFRRLGPRFRHGPHRSALGRRPLLRLCGSSCLLVLGLLGHHRHRQQVRRHVAAVCHGNRKRTARCPPSKPQLGPGA